MDVSKKQAAKALLAILTVMCLFVGIGYIGGNDIEQDNMGSKNLWNWSLIFSLAGVLAGAVVSGFIYLVYAEQINAVFAKITKSKAERASSRKTRLSQMADDESDYDEYLDHQEDLYDAIGDMVDYFLNAMYQVGDPGRKDISSKLPAVRDKVWYNNKTNNEAYAYIAQNGYWEYSGLYELHMILGTEAKHWKINSAAFDTLLIKQGRPVFDRPTVQIYATSISEYVQGESKAATMQLAHDFIRSLIISQLKHHDTAAMAEFEEMYPNN